MRYISVAVTLRECYVYECKYRLLVLDYKIYSLKLIV